MNVFAEPDHGDEEDGGHHGDRIHIAGDEESLRHDTEALCDQHQAHCCDAMYREREKRGTEYEEARRPSLKGS